MKGHPGGQENTRQMLALSGLRPGASILDMGAGAGETVALLQSLGYAARGIDLAPRSKLVEQADMHGTGFPGGSFDGVLSQCAFYISGDVDQALAESHRLLKPGGKLLLADVFFQEPGPLLARTGFHILQAMDMTAHDSTACVNRASMCRSSTLGDVLISVMCFATIARSWSSIRR